MRKTLFSFFVLTSLIAADSCKKNNSGIPNVTIDADVRAAFYYKVGTYWIYKDSISGRVDSFAVRSTKLTNMNVAGNVTIDGISINVTEYNGGSATDTSAWIINLASNYIELFWFKDKSTGLQYFDFLPVANYPFSTAPLTSVGGESGTDNNSAVVSVFPSFVLGSNTFNNVEETFHQYKYMNTINYNDLIYINDNQGLIKMNINDSSNHIYIVWELQKWHIVK